METASDDKALSMISESIPVSPEVAELRKRLSNVAWVQCDNTTCMKWRKVKKEAADKLTSDTWWECSMNDDPIYNTCAAPEEDTKSFDKLARRANLAVFKSELTPGSLVWAKTTGYCRWPALVTADPKCDEEAFYWEEDENELDKGYYHVEYLGKNHCHGWVFQKCVELFGEGNIAQASQADRNSSSILVDQEKKNTRKRKRKKVQHVKEEKRKYCGGSVNNAIEEALKLLPLPHLQRLQACKFLPKNVDLKVRSKKEETKQKTSCKNDKCIKKSAENDSKIKCRRTAKQTEISLRVKNVNFHDSCEEQTETCTDFMKACGRDTTFDSFDFMTSLFGITKEGRLFLDIEIRQEKERNFHERLQNFFLQHNLKSPSSPVWQDFRINLFDFFLAVYERGGFKKVTSSGQWSSVFCEVTNYPSKEWGLKAKSFYKRSLYPYELYLKSEDYSPVIKKIKMLGNPSASNRGNVHKKLKLNSCEEEEIDLNDAELRQALDELDHLLKSLEKKDQVAPDLKNNSFEDEIFRHEKTCIGQGKRASWSPAKGLQDGQPIKRDNAQVVPEMNFSGLSGSSRDSESRLNDDIDEPVQIAPHSDMDNGEEWVLQELQALEQIM